MGLEQASKSEEKTVATIARAPDMWGSIRPVNRRVLNPGLDDVVVGLGSSSLRRPHGASDLIIRHCPARMGNYGESLLHLTHGKLPYIWTSMKSIGSIVLMSQNTSIILVSAAC